jgi:ATP-dependent Lon protease
MVKRASRESPKDKSGTEDASDKGGRQKYDLRKRKLSTGSEPPNDYKPKKNRVCKEEEVLWVDDDTLCSGSDSEEDVAASSSSSPPVSLNIHFHTTVPNLLEEDSDSDSDYEEEEEEDYETKEDFITYLLDKYVGKTNEEPESEEEEEEKPKKTPRKKKEKLPIKLTAAETRYYNSLKPKKQEEFLEIMKRIAKLGLEDGETPYKFKVLELPIPDYTKSQLIKKINSLSDMPGDSGESYKLKNWIDGFFRIPFGKTTPLPVKYIDGRAKCTEFMRDAHDTMNRSIYGMNAAKTQIMQILAQLIVNPSAVGNVIALKGPMGVGKTSFAKNAIAKVLNRPFQFFSLGGASDISNFVGHSYTYEGSIWGRIADSLMHAGTMNPVFYFDELDKISTTPHGEEIVSMMIHMTDRSQNSEFHDRYFSGVDFDLSQCLFVFSLNDIEKVHPILRDRMMIINCDGYNEKDKKEILKGYVWPQLLDRLVFSTDEVCLTDDAIDYIIHEFSNSEKGVRTLIRTVETLMTRLNMLRVSYDESMKEYPFYMDVSFPLTIDEKIVRTLLCDLNIKEPETWVHMYT